MSDIRLVNVVPIVNGWNDAAKKNLEEAKTLMASGNHLDYNREPSRLQQGCCQGKRCEPRFRVCR